MTEGIPFRIVAATLLGVGATVGAWAVATTNQGTPLAAPSSATGSVLGPSSATGSVLATETPAEAASLRPSPSPPRERRYIVRDGDTLTAIAEQVYGDASLWTLLLEANRDRIVDPENLRIGTSLLIPNP